MDEKNSLKSKFRPFKIRKVSISFDFFEYFFILEKYFLNLLFQKLLVILNKNFLHALFH